MSACWPAQAKDVYVLMGQSNMTQEVGESFKANMPNPKNIELVMCAEGGSALSRWEYRKDLDLRCSSRIGLMTSLKGGSVKGILWHQGETDIFDEESMKTYKERFYKIVYKQLEYSIPFVSGQLGEFLYSEKDGHPVKNVRLINDACMNISHEFSYVDCISSSGLTSNDELHFDLRSQKELGRRYAIAMIKLQDAQK